MGLTKSLAQPILELFGKKAISKPLNIFLEEGLPRSDIPGLRNLAKEQPLEFNKWKTHTKNYVEGGDQGAGLEMIRIQDLANDTLNNQQIKSNTLAAKNANPQAQIQEIEALRVEGEHQFELRSGQDKGLSAISTGPELISGDKRIYQLSTDLRKPYQELEETLNAAPIAKEFHHKFNKAVSAPYFQRAWQLVDAGKATPEDIIALHRYALDAGVAAGDRESAMMMFERIPHNEFHEFIRSIGLEPRSGKFEKSGVTSKYSKTPGRKLRSKPSTNSPLKMEQSRIKKLETIEDLATDFKQTIDDTIVPMQEQAELLQEAWQSIDIKLRDELMEVWNQRNAARKAGDKNLAKTLDTKYKALKKQVIQQMKENRAKYGKELDESGNPDPESYGRAEIKKDLAVEKQLRGIQ